MNIWISLSFLAVSFLVQQAATLTGSADNKFGHFDTASLQERFWRIWTNSTSLKCSIGKLELQNARLQ